MQRRFLVRLATVLLGMATLSLGMGQVEASRVRPLNLEQLEDGADRIFLGRVTAVTREVDEGLGRSVFRVTLQVERSAKGPRGDTVTIRVLDVGGFIPGLAGFAVGDEVVLFLYPTSDRGLTSPVGLGQGRFDVRRDKEGRRFAVNPFGNRDLLRGLDARGRRVAADKLEGRTGGAMVDPLALLDAVTEIGSAQRGPP